MNNRFINKVEKLPETERLELLAVMLKKHMPQEVRLEFAAMLFLKFFEKDTEDHEEPVMGADEINVILDGLRVKMSVEIDFVNKLQK